MNIKKIISNGVERFDSGLKYTSAIGILLTLTAIIIIKVFNINVSQYLKDIPYIDYFIDMELIEKFENIDPDDEYYIELHNNLANLLGGQKVQEIKVRNDKNGQKTFRVMTSDGKYHYFIINKNGKKIEIFDQNKNKINLKEKKESDLTLSSPNTGSVNKDIGVNIENKVKQSYDKGKQEGYKNGQAIGYKIGYTDGKKVGGYDAGYTQGKKDGYTNGYNVGYKKGKAESTYQAGN